MTGDACRLLSKEEVGRAIGVEIVATQTVDSGCSYLAKGNSGDMTAKHMSAMMGARGADAKQQDDPGHHGRDVQVDAERKP